MDLNRVMLIGHVVKDEMDPDAVRTKSSMNGVPVTTFTLATRTKLSDRNREDRHRIVAFGRVAESCKQFLKDGDEVYVEGRLQRRMFGGEGEEGERSEVIANRVEFGEDVGRGQGKGEKVLYRSGDRSPNW